MSVKYILGPSGSGKTSHCVSDIMEFNNKDDTAQLIFVVPEQFSLESEKALATASPRGALIKTQVLSFKRLAFHLFSQMGFAKKKILEDGGKSMLLQKIAGGLKDELNFFGKSINKQGFAENLALTISEFYRYNISPERLKEYTDKTQNEKENLHLKLSDLYKIYKAYTDYIKKEYLVTDETLDILAEIMPESDYIKNSHIWIDGFNSFTPQEYKVIEKLLKYSSSLTLSFTTKENKTYFDKLPIHDPFFETKNSINKITKMARENNVKISEPVFLENSKRFPEESPLGFLEKNYFEYKPALYSKKSDDVKILKSENIYTEISFAAQKIHELVYEKDFLYGNIGLVCSDLEMYEKPIKSIFQTYEIPIFTDLKKDILSHPLTELIRSLVDITVHNYSYEGVFRFLKTGMTPLTTEQVDLLENYALANGIKGYRWFIKEWKYGFNNESFDKEEIHKIRDVFLESISPFCENLKYNSVLSVKELSVRIYKVLEKLDVSETLNKWLAETNDKKDPLYRFHSQIWKKISAVFEKMVEILGEEEITVSEYSKILEAGLAETDMGIIPPTQDSVIIGDFGRSRLPDIRALFILGVNDGKLPRPMDELGLFTDDERIYLTQQGMEVAPDSRKKTFEEQLIIYNTITKTKELLFLSYPSGNLDGKALRPSSVIAKVKNILPNLTEETENAENIISLPKPAFNKIGEILRDYSRGEEIPAVYLDMYNWFSENDKYKKSLGKMEKILFEGFDKPKLDPKTTRKLYGSELHTSVSRIEKYVNCPFSYFVEYNLKAKERRLYEVGSADFGNLFHNVIELFSKKLYDNHIGFRDIDRKKLDELTTICIEEIAPSIGNEILYSDSSKKYILKRIEKISKRSLWAIGEHIKSGLFEPMASEIEFSDNAPITGIVININNEERLVLSGRIDRVDIFTGQNRYVKILDYKSGSKKFDLSDIYFGMQLQLMLYLDAFIKNSRKIFKSENIESKVLPGGVFYFNIKDPILDYDGEPDKEILEKLLLKEFKMSGIVLAESEVIEAMDKELSGDIVPVKVKKDGELYNNSSVASLEDFEKIQKFINEKIRSLGEEIFGGSIAIKPFKRGNVTGCDYCKFSAICGIDASESGGSYNVFKKFDSAAAIFRAMEDFTNNENKKGLE